MELVYSAERPISSAEFIDVLRRSTLGERRPVDDPVCIAAMLRHADLLCTAWSGPHLVGVARSVTDFAYCCYLADLAVDASCQKRGIGKGLIRLTRQSLGPQCKLILLSAPKAAAYYPKIGFTAHTSAWILGPGDPLK
jgi:GNAT superfamily N-acetyltransferase